MTNPHECVVDVRRALAALPDRQRRAVVLTYFHAYPPGHLADALSTTEPDALVSLHQGAHALRALLGGSR